MSAIPQNFKYLAIKLYIENQGDDAFKAFLQEQSRVSVSLFPLSKGDVGRNQAMEMRYQHVISRMREYANTHLDKSTCAAFYSHIYAMQATIGKLHQDLCDQANEARQTMLVVQEKLNRFEDYVKSGNFT